MTNAYYNPTGNPLAQSRASSAVDRAEFASIGAAFNLLPAPATLAGDQQNYVIDTGSVNAMVVTLPPNITAFSDGMALTVLAKAACTGPSTITVGGIPATAVTRQDGSALESNDYVAGQIILLRYSAAQGSFQMSVASSELATQAAASAAAAATSAANAANAQVNTDWNATTGKAQLLNRPNFTLTPGAVITFPTSSATLARTDAAQMFTGIQTFADGGTWSATGISDPVIFASSYAGVGSTSSSSALLKVSGSGAMSANVQYGVMCQTTSTSAATSSVIGGAFYAATSAASYTSGNAIGIYVGPATAGAGSTITNAYGIEVVDQTVGTNNYGVWSGISSGTNKWNIYASGSANNYFAGRTLIGATTDNGTDELQVTGGSTVSGNISSTSGNIRVNPGGGTGGGYFSNLAKYSYTNNGNILFNGGTAANLILAETAANVYTFGSGTAGSVPSTTLALNTSANSVAIGAGGLSIGGDLFLTAPGLCVGDGSNSSYVNSFAGNIAALLLYGNTYWNGTANSYSSTGYSGIGQFSKTTGNWTFQTYASGTSGALPAASTYTALTPTNFQVMARTLIGTTIDDGTDQLQVNGSIKATSSLITSYAGIGPNGNSLSSLLHLSGSGVMGGSGYSYGVYSQPVGSSLDTVNLFGFVANPSTASASYTVSIAGSFHATTPVVGSGSTITNAVGYYTDDITTGTNNYGYQSAVTAGTNKLGFYNSGNANNNLGTGTTTVGTVSATGQIVSTVNSGTGLQVTPSTATNLAAIGFTNTGGSLSIGLDNSTAGAYGTAGNYGTVICRPASTGFAISRQGTVDLSISSVGAVAIGGTLASGAHTVTGAMSATTHNDGAGHLIFSSTAPSISSGFGTSPTITANNTAAFKVVIGTAPAGTGVLTLPAAPNGWVVDATDVTTPGIVVTQTAVSTTSATLSAYSRTTGAATNFNAGDVILIQATAF